ncbi:MAG: bifunctional (p)ppGpp synthetase/guanosine-3',5'-bis(diphosphate) 3'-pyrophosphohydrolase [Verrucomicrobia bacterium]|nr:bifunctional (p)ppGpp synthetase/guanosine-3',5'-bis(diphosphate) 3'-pyrophosphohydrolase [Verrucomicrobiota bacterium]
MAGELDSDFHKTWRALSFAARVHRHQTLADGVTPYHAHVIGVTWVVRHLFNLQDPLTLTAAALHDVLEDTPVTKEELAADFGEEAAAWVANLTKAQDLPEEEREADYVARLASAPEPVCLVKLADIYDNVSHRRGTSKMPKTLRNAHRYLDAVSARITSETGTRALEHVRRLLAEVESHGATA